MPACLESGMAGGAAWEGKFFWRPEKQREFRSTGDVIFPANDGLPETVPLNFFRESFEGFKVVYVYILFILNKIY